MIIIDLPHYRFPCMIHESKILLRDAKQKENQLYDLQVEGTNHLISLHLLQMY